MTNIQAAVGVAQIERIDKLLLKRKKIFENYNNLLKKTDKVKFLPKNNWSENSYWLYTILLKSNKLRNYTIKHLKNSGIDVRPSFYPLHLMPPYKKYSRINCNISEKIGLCGISLPSSNIVFAEQKYIIEKLLKIINKN